MSPTDVHRGRPVLRAGASPGSARGAVILVHGRGAEAAGMLPLARELAHPGIAFLAPQAAGRSWYPASFLAPFEVNEPHLSSALRALAAVVAKLAEEGVAAERTVLLGFSQGACLALEHAARDARRWGGVVAWTGGLIGPPGSEWIFGGDLAGTPVFLGAGDPDPHVPWERVEETARVLSGLGAEVDLRRYPGMAHTVNDEELAAASRIIGGLVAPSAAAS